MPTLKEVLQESKALEILEAANKLGFSNLWLFKPEKEGILGIYAELKYEDCTHEDMRKLSLVYVVAKVANSQAVVVTNKDPRGEYLKGSLIPWNKFSPENISKIFLKPNKEIYIRDSGEETYKYTVELYKLLYDSLVKTNPETLELNQESSQNSGYQTPVHFEPSDPKTKKRGYSATFEDIEATLMELSDKEFESFFAQLKVKRGSLRACSKSFIVC